MQTKSDTQTNQIALAADENYTEGEESVKYNDGTLMTLQQSTDTLEKFRLTKEETWRREFDQRHRTKPLINCDT